MLLTSWLSDWRRQLNQWRAVVRSVPRPRRRPIPTHSSAEPLEQRCLLTTIDLANLSTDGVTIFGANAGDSSGYSVSEAGDVNGDGFDDFLIGAHRGDGVGGATYSAGNTYIVFGGASLSGTIDLASLGPSGVTIFGIDGSDFSGRSVSGAGDVNGDGFDDVMIAADQGGGSGNGEQFAGETYVIFGQASLPPTIELASLGSAGITIFGADAGDQSGYSVSSAGDVNGDGFDDMLIGAFAAAGSGNAKTFAGESYVVFGKASLPATIDLGSLGSAGVTIFGADAGDNSGASVSSAGDVNGDGFGDLVIGAISSSGAGNAEPNAGETYVIFGKASLPTTINLATLGSAGITIFGADTFDFSGISVSNAGDVNGDGFDDLLIGANRGDGLDDLVQNAGESYVIFGGAALPTTIDLASLGAAGITIFGVDSLDYGGRSVSGAGDVNGDGFDDLLIGALLADGSGNAQSYAGEAYLIFGGASLPPTIDLANLGVAGITIFGLDANDNCGQSVSSAGDINGDGFDDLLIGARNGDGADNARADSGETYLIYGGDFTNAITHPGTSVAETLTGSAAVDVINGAAGNDTLLGNGGADVVYGGNGDDVLAISDLTFQRLDGGNGSDTLRIDGSGLTLNLTTLPDNRLTNIEVIDLRGSGSNSLTLNVREVLNLTANSNPAHAPNTLTVRRDNSDSVNIGPGWTVAGAVTIDSVLFDVFTQGAATLNVSSDALLVVGGPGVTWIKKQPPVKVLPQVIVSGDTSLAGGTLTINLNAVGTKKKALDLLVTPATSGLGTSTGLQFVNGHLTLQIQLGANVTPSAIQTFLRGITFSTKGKGLSTLTRTLDVTLAAAGEIPFTTIHQTINVRKKP